MVWPLKKREKIPEEVLNNNQLFPDFNEISREIEQTRLSKKFTPGKEHSFFEQLLKNIKKQTSNIESSLKLYNKGFLKQNMLKNMKHYWDEKKLDYMFNVSEQDLRNKLVSKVESLKTLEKEWQALHLTILQKEEQIRLQEKEMKSILKDLKDFCSHHLSEQKKTKKFQDVAHEHSLILTDGTIIKNLHDLQLALMSMSENTFRKHVNPRKNDFASWVRNSLIDHKLASKLEKTQKRAEMMHLLR